MRTMFAAFCLLLLVIAGHAQTTQPAWKVRPLAVIEIGFGAGITPTTMPAEADPITMLRISRGNVDFDRGGFGASPQCITSIEVIRASGKTYIINDAGMVEKQGWAFPGYEPMSIGTVSVGSVSFGSTTKP